MSSLMPGWCILCPFCYEVLSQAMDTGWRSEYSVGIDDVDDQHKHLLRLLGRVGQLADKGKDGRALAKLMGELQDYAAYHFSSEEHLMNSSSLPTAHIQRHLAAHSQYWRGVAEFQGRLNDGDDSVAPALNEFLQRWWVDHICEVDRELGRLMLAASGSS